MTKNPQKTSPRDDQLQEQHQRLGPRNPTKSFSCARPACFRANACWASSQGVRTEPLNEEGGALPGGGVGEGECLAKEEEH